MKVDISDHEPSSQPRPSRRFDQYGANMLGWVGAVLTAAGLAVLAAVVHGARVGCRRRQYWSRGRGRCEKTSAGAIHLAGACEVGCHRGNAHFLYLPAAQ